MKALTLTEPWATLVMLGAKRYETRSWNTTYRGQLIIHAAKGFPKWAKALVNDEPFKPALEGYGVNRPFKLGCVLGTVELVDTFPTTDFRLSSLTDQEVEFGDYGDGRHAWQLDNPIWLPEPVPYKGALGLWEYNAD